MKRAQKMRAIHGETAQMALDAIKEAKQHAGDNSDLIDALDKADVYLRMALNWGVTSYAPYDIRESREKSGREKNNRGQKFAKAERQAEIKRYMADKPDASAEQIRRWLKKNQLADVSRSTIKNDLRDIR